MRATINDTAAHGLERSDLHVYVSESVRDSESPLQCIHEGDKSTAHIVTRHILQEMS